MNLRDTFWEVADIIKNLIWGNGTDRLLSYSDSSRLPLSIQTICSHLAQAGAQLVRFVLDTLTNSSPASAQRDT